MKLTERIESFVILGKKLKMLLNRQTPENDEFEAFIQQIEETEKLNPWFIPAYVTTAIKAISANLAEEKLKTWLDKYPNIHESVQHPKVVGVVMAGNIPLVGFNDMLCTLMAGHIFKGKPSSRDGGLMKFITRHLINIRPEFQELIQLEENLLTGVDAVIATGSDNTSRYFEYYFSKYPHIIRKNRNSVAVLSGRESKEELKSLADDIFLYFGLGCRSVSKLFVPTGYDFTPFFETIECYNFVYNHNKYANNYDYHKVVFLMNKIVHLDNGFLLLREERNYASPMGVLYYENYSDITSLNKQLNKDKDVLQCTVSHMESIHPRVALGKTQYPGLTEYADDIDTMSFLLYL